MTFEQLPLLLLLTLAVYRVSILITWEDAPYRVFYRFRLYLGRKANGGGVVWGELAELFHCPFCLGMWLSLLAAVLVGGGWVNVLLMWFAISGGQHLLTAVTKHWLGKE